MSGESAGGFPASKFLLSEKDTQSLTAPLGSSGRIKVTDLVAIDLVASDAAAQIKLAKFNLVHTCM